MAFTKKGKEYLEFRRKMFPLQGSFHQVLGIKSRTDNTTRGYPYGSDHSDPKEAEKRIDEAMKWL